MYISNVGSSLITEVRCEVLRPIQFMRTSGFPRIEFTKKLTFRIKTSFVWSTGKISRCLLSISGKRHKEKWNIDGTVESRSRLKGVCWQWQLIMITAGSGNEIIFAYTTVSLFCFPQLKKNTWHEQQWRNVFLRAYLPSWFNRKVLWPSNTFPYLMLSLYTFTVFIKNTSYFISYFLSFFSLLFTILIPHLVSSFQLFIFYLFIHLFIYGRNVRYMNSNYLKYKSNTTCN